jgi:hypothetical protein
MNKEQIDQTLRQILPNVAITTVWQPDYDASSHDLDVDNPNSRWCGWLAWSATVRATAIIDGSLITGDAYLGSVFELAAENPADCNPDISGYYLDMVLDALLELRSLAVGQPVLREQIANAIAKLIE